MQEVKLGKLIEGEACRDAIHVALALKLPKDDAAKDRPFVDEDMRTAARLEAMEKEIDKLRELLERKQDVDDDENVVLVLTALNVVLVLTALLY